MPKKRKQRRSRKPAQAVNPPAVVRQEAIAPAIVDLSTYGQICAAFKEADNRANALSISLDELNPDANLTALIERCFTTEMTFEAVLNQLSVYLKYVLADFVEEVTNDAGQKTWRFQAEFLLAANLEALNLEQQNDILFYLVRFHVDGVILHYSKQFPAYEAMLASALMQLFSELFDLTSVQKQQKLHVNLCWSSFANKKFQETCSAKIRKELADNVYAEPAKSSVFPVIILQGRTQDDKYAQVDDYRYPRDRCPYFYDIEAVLRRVAGATEDYRIFTARASTFLECTFAARRIVLNKWKYFSSVERDLLLKEFEFAYPVGNGQNKPKVRLFDAADTLVKKCQLTSGEILLCLSDESRHDRLVRAAKKIDKSLQQLQTLSSLLNELFLISGVDLDALEENQQIVLQLRADAHFVSDEQAVTLNNGKTVRLKLEFIQTNDASWEDSASRIHKRARLKIQGRRNTVFCGNEYSGVLSSLVTSAQKTTATQFPVLISSAKLSSLPISIKVKVKQLLEAGLINSSDALASYDSINSIVLRLVCASDIQRTSSPIVYQHNGKNVELVVQYVERLDGRLRLQDGLFAKSVLIVENVHQSCAQSVSDQFVQEFSGIFKTYETIKLTPAISFLARLYQQRERLIASHGMSLDLDRQITSEVGDANFYISPLGSANYIHEQLLTAGFSVAETEPYLVAMKVQEGLYKDRLDNLIQSKFNQLLAALEQNDKPKSEEAFRFMYWFISAGESEEMACELRANKFKQLLISTADLFGLLKQLYRFELGIENANMHQMHVMQTLVSLKEAVFSRMNVPAALCEFLFAQGSFEALEKGLKYYNSVRNPNYCLTTTEFDALIGQVFPRYIIDEEKFELARRNCVKNWMGDAVGKSYVASRKALRQENTNRLKETHRIVDELRSKQDKTSSLQRISAVISSYLKDDVKTKADNYSDYVRGVGLGRVRHNAKYAFDARDLINSALAGKLPYERCVKQINALLERTYDNDLYHGNRFFGGSTLRRRLTPLMQELTAEISKAPALADAAQPIVLSVAISEQGMSAVPVPVESLESLPRAQRGVSSGSSEPPVSPRSVEGGAQGHGPIPGSPSGSGLFGGSASKSVGANHAAGATEAPTVR